MGHASDTERDIYRKRHRDYMATAPGAPGAACDGRVQPTWARIDPPNSDGGGCSLLACKKCGRLFSIGGLKGEYGNPRVVAVWEPVWAPEPAVASEPLSTE